MACLRHPPNPLTEFRLSLARALVAGTEFDTAWSEALAGVGPRWRWPLAETRASWCRESTPLDGLAEAWAQRLD